MNRRVIGNSVGVVAASLVFAAPAFGQSISVYVNGNPIRFAGQGPIQMNGRVLVPVRGVFESLGAFVGYDGPTHTVHASRGDKDISLGIGQKLATVNGEEAVLDVPPMVVNGSTMVPLRFIGEALGAEVTWDNARQAVMIATNGAADTNARANRIQNQDHRPASDVRIESFNTDANGFVRGGSNVDFTLVGTPGGQASLQIPGIAQEVPMQEVSPGRYVAKLNVAGNSPINIRNANAVARLRLGSQEKMIQAANQFSVDTQPPTIGDFTPAPDSRMGRARPNITATLEDDGSGLAENSVRVILDNRDVTQDASVGKDFVAYRPDQPLPPGRHTVEVRASDLAGNSAAKRWTFDVISSAEVIKTFDYRAPESPQPGDVITFQMSGEPGQSATFDIGKTYRDIPMRESSPGTYVGEYTVRRGDVFRNEKIVGKLRTRSGEVYSSDAPRRLGTHIGPPTAPVISEPGSNDTVSNQLVVRGRAEPRTKVRVRVDYRSSLLGLLGFNGSVGEQVVESDANGNFATEPFSLKGLGGSTTYTVTATAIGTNDQESRPTTLTIGQ